MNNIVTIVAASTVKITAEIKQKICELLKIELSNVKELRVDRAYDFYCDDLTDEKVKTVGQYLDKLQIDVFFLNASYRTEKKLLMSDMDSTLIENECIDEIARSVGIYDEIAKITQETMDGNMLFEGSLLKRVALLEGVHEDKLSSIYDEHIKLHPGVTTTSSVLRGLGVKLVIVSGGFTYFCNRVALDAGFDGFYANELIFEDGILTGKVKLPVFSSESKAEILTKLVEQDSLDVNQIIAVGDGANDLPFLTKVPFSVGYKAKNVVVEKVRFNIRYSDYSAILAILGIVH